MIFSQLDGLIQLCRAVVLDPLGRSSWNPSNELLQYNQIDRFLDAAFPGHQPLGASVLELLGHDERLAAVPQIH